MRKNAAATLSNLKRRLSHRQFSVLQMREMVRMTLEQVGANSGTHERARTAIPGEGDEAGKECDSLTWPLHRQHLRGFSNPILATGNPHNLHTFGCAQRLLAAFGRPDLQRKIGTSRIEHTERELFAHRRKSNRSGPTSQSGKCGQNGSLLTSG